MTVWSNLYEVQIYNQLHFADPDHVVVMEK